MYRELYPPDGIVCFTLALEMLPDSWLFQSLACSLRSLYRGQNPADAEYKYLDMAKRVDTYGVDLHSARVRVSIPDCRWR